MGCPVDLGFRRSIVLPASLARPDHREGLSLPGWSGSRAGLVKGRDRDCRAPGPEWSPLEMRARTVRFACTSGRSAATGSVSAWIWATRWPCSTRWPNAPTERDSPRVPAGTSEARWTGRTTLVHAASSSPLCDPPGSAPGRSGSRHCPRARRGRVRGQPHGRARAGGGRGLSGAARGAAGRGRVRLPGGERRRVRRYHGGWAPAGGLGAQAPARGRHRRPRGQRRASGARSWPRCAATSIASWSASRPPARRCCWPACACRRTTVSPTRTTSSASSAPWRSAAGCR